MIEARRDELECRRFPTKEGRNLCRRLPRRALTVARPEPPAGRVPDAVACPFLKTIWRELRDLIENEPALHQNAKVLLKVLLFAAAFRVAEPGEQRNAIEHYRRVGGKHHIRQTRNARHDLQPCPGSDERCCERSEAVSGRSPVTHRIFGPGAGLHPRVDRIGHLEMGGIGQQQQRFRRHGGLPQKISGATRADDGAAGYQRKASIIDKMSCGLDKASGPFGILWRGHGRHGSAPYRASSPKRPVTRGNPGQIPQSLARYGAESHRSPDSRRRHWRFYRAAQTRSRTATRSRHHHGGSRRRTCCRRAQIAPRHPGSSSAAHDQRPLGHCCRTRRGEPRGIRSGTPTYPTYQGDFEFRNESAVIDAQDLSHQPQQQFEPRISHPTHCHFPGAVKTPCAIRPSRPPSMSCKPSATWLTPRITPRSSSSGLNQRTMMCATSIASQSRNRMK